jgi:diguanylate cyclase (GGDEF)-like protein
MIDTGSLKSFQGKFSTYLKIDKKNLDQQNFYIRTGFLIAGIGYSFMLSSDQTGEFQGWSKTWMLLYLALSLASIVLSCTNEKCRNLIRSIAVVGDPLFLVSFTYLIGESGALLVFLFSWVPISNGFRYGEKWLLVSTLFCSLGLLFVLFTNANYSDASLLLCSILAGHILVISFIGEVLRSYRKTQERLAAISMRDALTGLPNRRLFIEHLHHLMLTSRRSQKHIACFFVDLDGFKAINDKLGHGVGDKVLVMVADVMRSQLRQGDIAARLSGDEFMYATECGENHLEIVTVAERLLHGIERISFVDGNRVRLSASIGIGFYKHVPGGRNPDPDKLIGESDKMMYEAKHSGKGKICISKES